jgi:hypothetical protein
MDPAKVPTIDSKFGQVGVWVEVVVIRASDLGFALAGSVACDRRQGTPRATSLSTSGSDGSVRLGSYPISDVPGEASDFLLAASRTAASPRWHRGR